MKREIEAKPKKTAAISSFLLKFHYFLCLFLYPPSTTLLLSAPLRLSLGLGLEKVHFLFHFICIFSANRAEYEIRAVQCSILIPFKCSHKLKEMTYMTFRFGTVE